MQRAFFLLFFLFFSSCGYHWGREKEDGVVFLNIPYAKGDVDGSFTNTLIKRISDSPFFQYDANKTDLLLKVNLRDMGSENIGYRHDRDSEGNPKKTILPTEGREKLQAEVCIIESSSQKILFGPVTVEADADFDFITKNTLRDLTFVDAQNNTEPLLFFSMGQLEPAPSAQEAAKKVAQDCLARKIVHLMSGACRNIYEKNCP
jgi:hypothetical protein